MWNWQKVFQTREWKLGIAAPKLQKLEVSPSLQRCSMTMINLTVWTLTTWICLNWPSWLVKDTHYSLFHLFIMWYFWGDVPHKVTFRADIRVYLGTRLWFGDCKNYARKTCATEATSTGFNKILVTLSASDYQTYTIGDQDYLEFKLGIQVENNLEDSTTYAPMSAPRGSGCNLEVLGIKIDSIDKYIQRGANSYLKSQVNKVNELRGPKLIQRLEDVLQARLGSVVTLPVNITGVNGRRKREAVKRCQRKECPSGFFRIGNTQRCQKTFGPSAPNCSQYGQNAEMKTTQIAGGAITVYSCHVDMIPIWSDNGIFWLNLGIYEYKINKSVWNLTWLVKNCMITFEIKITIIGY